MTMHYTRITARLSTLAGLCLLLSCASTKKAEVSLPGPFEVQGSAMQLPASTAEGSDEVALSEAMQTACDGPCTRVNIQITEDTTQDVLETIAAAARRLSSPPTLSALPPSGKPIPLAVHQLGPKQCPALVVVEQDKISVAFDGEPATPDLTCDQWKSAVCRTDDGWDWPRLRSVVGNARSVCVHVATGGAGAALDAINDTLRRPTITLVEPMSFEGSIAEDEAKKEIARHKGDIEWCYRQVLEKKPPADVRVKWLVDADGTVPRAEVVQIVRGTRQFEECLADVAMKFDFDPPGAPVVVEHPVPDPG